MIGINESVLSNIKVLNMDVDKLNRRASYKQEKISVNIQTVTEEEQKIHYVNIKDGYVFDWLQIKAIEKDEKINGCCDLGMFIKDFCGADVNPLNVEAYEFTLRKIRKYIYQTYGVNLDFKEICFKEIQVNTTFDLNSDFSEYEYLLNRINEVAPKKYKTIKQHHYYGMLKGITLINESTKLNIYDKKFQLLDEVNFKIDENLMRIEYTFKNATEVKKALGTNKLKELTNEAIKQCIKKNIDDDIIQPLLNNVEGNDNLRRIEYIQKHLDNKGA